jgi:FMNH2-dependent dimethyl sulfone monooxygenase
MRFGYWLPVFGGWLRNVDDERMSPTWDYVKTLAQRSEQWGYDLTLIAELNLNDIKGVTAPSLDAWSTAASLAAITSTLELMVAVRPTFHEPALLAKQAANIDHISGGRLSLNVVSSWWAQEARQYGVQFDQHDERYARTREWLKVVDGLWREPQFSFKGRFYSIDEAILEPKPVARPRPTIYAGGESEAARDLISELADAYVMHGDAPSVIARRVDDMRARRDRTGHQSLAFGVAAYAIVRDSEAEARAEVARITDVKQSAAGYGNYQQWIANTKLEQQVSLEDYSVSNRGLRSGLVGTPEQIQARLREFEDAGVVLLLLQCSPQLEEMERFAQQVIAPYRRHIAPAPATNAVDSQLMFQAALSEGIRSL